MALTYGQARRILAEWHGGQASPVYAVMSSGSMRYRSEAIDELMTTLSAQPLTDTQNIRELDAVIVWLQFRATLGAVPRDEWVNAWDDTPV